MKRVRSLVAATAALAATGCYTTTYKTATPGGGKTHEESASYFIYGLVGDKTVNLSEICPEGVSEWKDYQSIGDSILGCITAGIYTPKSITVTCAGGKTALLTPRTETHQTEVQFVDARLYTEGSR